MRRLVYALVIRMQQNQISPATRPTYPTKQLLENEIDEIN